MIQFSRAVQAEPLTKSTVRLTIHATHGGTTDNEDGNSSLRYTQKKNKYSDQELF